MNNLFVLSGPTGVGKTAISIKLAKELNGEIISADSMQVYKGMDIGSAKISKDEMQGVPHYLIDIVEPDKSFSAAEFKENALKALDLIISKNKLPIIVGGTGLYIESLICNYNFTEAGKDDEYRKHLESLALSHGNIYVHDLLKDIDWESYKNIHPNNLKRVIRALEVYRLTGKTISEFSKKDGIYDIPYNLYYFILNMNRGKLYNRINMRVDIMFEQGLVEEVARLKESGYNSGMQSMQGIGYKEILYYLEGKIALEEARNMIKQGSRNYAKRQLTWFRKDKRAVWIDKDLFSNDDEITDYILNIMNKSCKI